jgi:hypothetical protein
VAFYSKARSRIGGEWRQGGEDQLGSRDQDGEPHTYYRWALWTGIVPVAKQNKFKKCFGGGLSMLLWLASNAWA